MPRVPRRGATAGLAVISALLLGVVACSSGDRSATDAAARSSTAPTGSSVPARASTTAASSGGCPRGAPASTPYAAGRRHTTFVDTTRGTNGVPRRNLAPSPQRTLPITIIYPAASGPPGSITDDAPPADGAFPWVLYSHGVLSSGDERNDVLARWVRAGYVVVAPTYPLSSGAGTEVADLPNQGKDVDVVVDRFRALVAGADALHGHVLPDCLALAGHSLGAATTMLATFDPCCDTTGARAAISVSGFYAPTPGAPPLAQAPRTPVLLVHGAVDPVVSIDLGRRTFDELTGPRWFVTFPSGDHNSMFVPPQADALDAAVVAFLDARLRGEPAGLDGLAARLAPGGVTVEARPGA